MSRPMILATILAFALNAGIVQAESLPMPPAFSLAAPVEQTLRAYPLGVITKQAAFSHHGTAHREIKLPNGLEGWVYDVGGLPKATTYSNAGGKKQTMREKEISHETRSYTLVFDTRGLVIDVLYNESGRQDGLTALSEQYRKGLARTEAHGHSGPGQ